MAQFSYRNSKLFSYTLKHFHCECNWQWVWRKCDKCRDKNCTENVELEETVDYVGHVKNLTITNTFTSKIIAFNIEILDILL